MKQTKNAKSFDPKNQINGLECELSRIEKKTFVRISIAMSSLTIAFVNISFRFPLSISLPLVLILSGFGFSSFSNLNLKRIHPKKNPTTTSTRCRHWYVIITFQYFLFHSKIALVFNRKKPNVEWTIWLRYEHGMWQMSLSVSLFYSEKVEYLLIWKKKLLFLQIPAWCCFLFISSNCIKMKLCASFMSLRNAQTKTDLLTLENITHTLLYAVQIDTAHRFKIIESTTTAFSSAWAQAIHRSEE